MKRYRSAASMKKRLTEIILERTFRFSEKPTFKLASGKMSSYYFNCKPTTLNPEGMYLTGALMYDLIKSRKSWKIKAIGGLTLGADPISNAVAYTSYRKDDPLESFVVRKEPKKHGTMLWVEGNVTKGDKVIIVEDVVTTGGSTIKAIDRARKCGLNVLGVIVLIDRQEGGKQAVEKKGVPVKVLFTREEIMASHRTSV